MKNSQDEYEAFMQKVHDWEKQKNENLAGRVKSKHADTEAIGRQTDSFQTKECLGYFWSQYFFEKHEETAAEAGHAGDHALGRAHHGHRVRRGARQAEGGH